MAIYAERAGVHAGAADHNASDALVPMVDAHITEDARHVQRLAAVIDRGESPTGGEKVGDRRVRRGGPVTGGRMINCT